MHSALTSISHVSPQPQAIWMDPESPSHILMKCRFSLTKCGLGESPRRCLFHLQTTPSTRLQTAQEAPRAILSCPTLGRNHRRVTWSVWRQDGDLRVCPPRCLQATAQVQTAARAGSVTFHVASSEAELTAGDGVPHCLLNAITDRRKTFLAVPQQAWSQTKPIKMGEGGALLFC